jgi:ribose/xylose/arabinose/galactoside ABC-type transport system permease subunit
MMRVGLQRAQLLALCVVLAALSFFFSQRSAGFADWGNLRNILLDASPTVICAVAMTFIIVTRGIDLSIGSVANMALAAAVMAAGAGDGHTTFIAYPIAIAAGLVAGLLNGLIISYIGINPLIATLGTMTLFRGIGLHLTGASLSTVEGPLTILGRTQLFGLGLPVWLALAVVATGTLVLAQTVAGRQLLALGGSPRSARETGIVEGRLLLAVYTLAGVAGAVAGLIIVGRVGVLTSELGFGFEFTVITAVVLGGTSLFGGRGTIVGSALGAILLTTIQNGLNLIGADPYYYDVVRGAVLMAAVTADTLMTRLAYRA